jgi:hypothetical protein
MAFRRHATAADFIKLLSNKNYKKMQQFACANQTL